MKSTAGSGFDLDRLRTGGSTFRLHYFSRLRSTNDHAARLRRAGKLFAPAMVLAGMQTAGRGRGQNTWWSGKESGAGALTVTFVLPARDRVPPQELPLIAGLATRDAAAELTGQDRIQLKWPNDILYQGKKIGGLLCQRISKADLVGIGLNVNIDPASAPAELRGRITSLKSISKKTLDMTEVLLAIAEHLRRAIRRRLEQPFSAFVRDFNRHDALAGRRVRIFPGNDEPPVDGTCQGVDDKGRLILRRRGGVLRVVAGHVALLGDLSR
jgi:BirA family transcriptional regulator, biotin operon repressor / biotin---[acetyl-CoA-carboxylase] ligase